MSDKNTKRIDIKIPKYDVEGQLSFINSVCEVCKFDTKTLLTLIFADWINSFQELSLTCGDFEKAFYSFLSTCSKTAENLKELKKEVENEKRK